LQNFCVVDLSNFYLDIAKDRLYVSAAHSPRRRSCQTVMALVVERLAGLIAPVLCHMAEDIWQNLPYPVRETSVFERGWPQSAAEWTLTPAEQATISTLQGLRSQVNRQLEACRKPKQEQGGIGSSLETRLQLELVQGEGAAALRSALDQLEQSASADVDNLADWLLVSELEIGSGEGRDQLAEPFAELLAEASEGGITLRIARARGEKCERCWHYETDISAHVLNATVHGRLCGRCHTILSTQAPLAVE